MKKRTKLKHFIQRTFIVICILIITVVSIAIGVKMLVATNTFTKVFERNISNKVQYITRGQKYDNTIPTSESNDGADITKSSELFELEKLVELNNAVFSNNFQNFIFTIITSIFLAFGGAILNRSLNYKNEAKELLREVETVREKMTEKYNDIILENKKIKHLEHLVINFENATNTILFSIAQDANNIVAGNQLSKFRDQVFDIRNYISELNHNYSKNPFSSTSYNKFENNSIDLFRMKVDTLLSYIDKSDKKSYLYAPIEMLKECYAILTSWRK